MHELRHTREKKGIRFDRIDSNEVLEAVTIFASALVVIGEDG